MNAEKLKTHIRSLLQGDKPNRSKSVHRNRDEEDGSDTDRRSRATTPSGRALLEEVSLKPVGERKIPGRLGGRKWMNTKINLGKKIGERTDN